MTKQLIEIGPATNSRSPCPPKRRGWYVLYHDGIAHYVRRAGDLEGAIRAAACLLADGRVVDQVGSLNDEDREDVIGPSEIRQRCAALPIRLPYCSSIVTRWGRDAITVITASLVLFLLAIVAAAPGRAAPADQAGVATAVNTTALALPPGGSESVLDVGAAVVQRERIATDTEGQAQLLMLDGSSFTIGPGASVVLDEFYFDPATGSGRAGLSLAKGILRFVGGKLSKSQAVTIETPNGTVGIRAGIPGIEVDDATTSTRATFLYGSEMTVTGRKGGIARGTSPGYAVRLQRNAAPSKPVRGTARQL